MKYQSERRATLSAGAQPPPPPQIIKGCWQLGGEHAGSDKASNRTTGQAALEDFERFFRSGITSVDVADIYGSAETVVGQYLRLHPQRRPGLQVATKLCFFGQEMLDVTADVVEYVSAICCIVFVGHWPSRRPMLTCGIHTLVASRACGVVVCAAHGPVGH